MKVQRLYTLLTLHKQNKMLKQELNTRPIVETGVTIDDVVRAFKAYNDMPDSLRYIFYETYLTDNPRSQRSLAQELGISQSTVFERLRAIRYILTRG